MQKTTDGCDENNVTHTAGQTSSPFISIRETDSDPDGEDERQIGKDGISGKTHDAQDRLQPFNVKERIGGQGAWVGQCATETQ
ncbi:hypothetical protein SDC9_79798 [bioreactor metagenome]|uniref:Uncharacterized protein n=1 Tax=bioreactor metagenome TaxID=1076179 RepID=A0A644YY45_9ZZZZ